MIFEFKEILNSSWPYYWTVGSIDTTRSNSLGPHDYESFLKHMHLKNSQRFHMPYLSYGLKETVMFKQSLSLEDYIAKYSAKKYIKVKTKNYNWPMYFQ